MRRLAEAACLFMLPLCAWAEFGQALPFNADWTITTAGYWQARVDHRILLDMAHPWMPSHPGGYASVSRVVRAPEQLSGPLFLSFYNTDDYQAHADAPAGPGLRAEGFIGHRLKQVLVDNEVVWNQDVADPVRRGDAPLVTVPLRVRADQSFLLTLLAYDAEPSTTLLPGDYYCGPAGDGRCNDGNSFNFRTRVFWGDLYLHDATAQPPQGRRPSEAAVLNVHRRRWPLPPFGDGWPTSHVDFTLDAADGLPDAGFPLCMGIPLPAGRAYAVDDVRFETTNGARIAAQKAALSSWPDGSIQWLLADFLVNPAEEKVRMSFSKDSASGGTRRISVAQQGDQVAVTAGEITLNLPAGDLPRSIARRGRTIIETLRLIIEVHDELIPASVEHVETLELGPRRATLVFDGRFDSMTQTVGSFSLYLSVFDTAPFMKCAFVLFNDSEEALLLQRLNVELGLPDTPQFEVPGGTLKDAQTLRQVDYDNRRLGDSAVEPAGPVYVSWDEGVALVAHFQEQWPKSIQTDDNRLLIGLVDAREQPLRITPGEASSHEFWLALTPADPAVLAASVDRPPLLLNPAYFCATGVLGPADPDVWFAALREHMAATYAGKSWPDLGQRTGVRDFPDEPFPPGGSGWANNYYERMLNLWSAWFVHGGRAWYDRAVDVSRHVFDVAVVHSEIPGRDWLGSMHGPGANHVPGPWLPGQRTEGLALYHKLTGDPEARMAVLGVADFCVRTRAGVDAPSTRQQAGPFDAVLTAFLESGDVDLLDEGTARVESVWRAMDRRRGVWAEEHGSAVYRGNVPWMAAQLARPLYWWYRQTGDVESAQALVALAEAIACENAPWDKPGAIMAYSHNPRLPETNQFDLALLPLFFAAHELTDDPFFLEAAAGLWMRWNDAPAFDSIFGVYWNIPWSIWYLQHHGWLPAEAPAE